MALLGIGSGLAQSPKYVRGPRGNLLRDNKNREQEIGYPVTLLTRQSRTMLQRHQSRLATHPAKAQGSRKPRERWYYFAFDVGPAVLDNCDQRHVIAVALLLKGESTSSAISVSTAPVTSRWHTVGVRNAKFLIHCNDGTVLTYAPDAVYPGDVQTVDLPIHKRLVEECRAGGVVGTCTLNAVDGVPRQRLHPPGRFSVLIGECVHNIRSAVDNLVWGLARTLKPKCKCAGLAFPMLR